MLPYKERDKALSMQYESPTVKGIIDIGLAEAHGMAKEFSQFRRRTSGTLFSDRSVPNVVDNEVQDC
jgi:hypothetical protein